METKVEEKNQPAVLTPELVNTQTSFGDSASFNHVQRVAKMLSESDLIPAAYKKNIPNTMIALEMANRIGATPLMVMQNLHVIQGKPSWSSAFIIAAINNCKKFTPLRFDLKGSGDTLECTAKAKDIASGENLVGPKVTMAMAVAEGWVSKAGSKWKTMPELMIQYRAAAFFGRLYVPEIMMGMHTDDELRDITPVSELPAIAFEDLDLLFQNKKSLLDKDELKDAERIMETKEEKSYGKLQKLLLSK